MKKQKACGINRLMGTIILIIVMTPVFGKTDVPRTATIISVSEPQILYGTKTSATLWAKVKSDSGISRVWAEIYPPDFSESVVLELKDTGKDGIFKEVYEFTLKGIYDIYISAEDAQGNISSPQITDVSTEPDEDDYEADNTFSKAKVIVLNEENPQKHNFYKAGDQDWVKFYGISGQTYVIEADNLSDLSDIVLGVYGADGTSSLLPETDNGQTGADERLELTLSEDTLCYVNIYDKNSTSGRNTEYQIQINLKYAPVSARFQGSAANAVSKAPLGNVMIRTDQSVTALSDENADGNYTMYHPVSQSFSTAYTLTARFPGYEIFTISVFTSESCSGGKTCFKTFAVSDSTGQRTDPELVEWDGVIELVPLKGDINGDGKADLADAVLGLQALAGIESEKIRQDYVESHTDVNADNKIGMEDMLFILQKLAEKDNQINGKF